MNGRHPIHAFLQEDSGQDMIEYALMLSLIALGAVACMRNLSTQINSLIFIAAHNAGLM